MEIFLWLLLYIYTNDRWNELYDFMNGAEEFHKIEMIIVVDEAQLTFILNDGDHLNDGKCVLTPPKKVQIICSAWFLNRILICTSFKIHSTSNINTKQRIYSFTKRNQINWIKKNISYEANEWSDSRVKIKRWLHMQMHDVSFIASLT